MFSKLQIKQLEEYYSVELPRSYKLVLLVIGEKIVNFLQKQFQLLNDLEPLSIHKIQTVMRISEDDSACDEPEFVNRLLHVFWLTTFVAYNNQELISIAYFIDPQGEEDCPVYGWIYNDMRSTNSIQKVSDSIEGWLHQLDRSLYIEFQTKKILCNISFDD